MSKGFSFKVLKRSKKSGARLGVISTPHGEIETPAFVPVATRGTVRTLDSDDIRATGAQLLICNTYHLHLTPGENIVKKAGGLHKFMNWDRPLFTDSGGFQVFSLGFGNDHGMGKILKEEKEKNIVTGAQSQHVKITEEGVHFRSPVDGRKLYLDPETSIKIQEDLGADVAFAFDECPSPLASDEYMRISIDRTHRWAARCLKAKKRKDQALYGIVQGGSNPAFRKESAEILGAMEFEGYGIGGEFGYDKKQLEKNVRAVTMALPDNKPRHLLGVGHPEDFPFMTRAGADTFDCIAPTHYARRATIFTSLKGKLARLDIRNQRYLKDFKPLDPNCECPICESYSRAYICHLFRSHEMTGMKLASLHNVFFLNKLAADMRKKIKNDQI